MQTIGPIPRGCREEATVDLGLHEQTLCVSRYPRMRQLHASVLCVRRSGPELRSHDPSLGTAAFRFVQRGQVTIARL
jgi:hypothetical protein